MNPFDLRGPEFLAFYVVLGLVVLGALAFFRLRRHTGSTPSDLADPYLIAYLRGGANEALRVATVSLIDRGLIAVQGDIGTTVEGKSDAARRPIEKALLEHFKYGAAGSSVFTERSLREACEPLEEHLVSIGALPGLAQRAAMSTRWLLATALVGGVAAVKIAVALSRGRSNVLFLVMLGIAFLVIVWKVAFRDRTPLGDRLLQDLQALFSRLKDAAYTLKPGGGTNELALLAAVWGLHAIPVSVFPHPHALYPRAAAAGNASSWTGTWNSSCGSGCGTSSSSCSSSSCGSSCGGGGCGGGCGGCGG